MNTNTIENSKKDYQAYFSPHLYSNMCTLAELKVFISALSIMGAHMVNAVSS